MSEHIGYAVYSKIEGGYLVTPSPSNYHWDPAAALMYETTTKAWASAKRRGPGYAIAVAIGRDEDGSLHHEDLSPPMKAASGSWIVRIEDAGLPIGPLYITSLSRDGKSRASTEICDARGFSHQQALELATKLKSRPNCTAQIEQVSD